MQFSYHVNIRIQEGLTPLHCAAKSFMDANEVSLELIRSGVDINATTNVCTSVSTR